MERGSGVSAKKRIAILQSNYIPWKGYFDIIRQVDEFILYDDMQYTRRDWRNRNKIVTPDGLLWLTIPVLSKGKYDQKINETKVADHTWVDSHWKSIQCNYARAKYFGKYEERIRGIYEACRKEEYLSRINTLFIREICDILEIRTKISRSSEYRLAEGKTSRLVQLVKDAGGDAYLSGPAAKDYIEEHLFSEEGIALEWMDYSGYPPYRQLSGHFEHGVSVLDLIFNEGERALEFIKHYHRS